MRPLKAFTFIDPDYLPGGFPIPLDAAVAVGNVSDHVRQCRVIVTALDAVQAENMLVQRGLAPSPSSFVHETDGSPDVEAMRAAKLLVIPQVWLLVEHDDAAVVVQVFDDNMRRGGRIARIGEDYRFFEADPEPTAPAGIDRAVVDWTAKRHRDALATSISEAIGDLGLLPTKLVRGGHIASELNAIIGRLVDAAGRARALEVLDEIRSK